MIIVLLCFGFYGYMYYINELKRQLESNRQGPAYPVYPDCPACNVKCPACPSYPACPDSSVSKSSIAEASKEVINESIISDSHREKKIDSGKYSQVDTLTTAQVGVSENDSDIGFNLWLENCKDVCKICNERDFDNCDGICSNCNKGYYDELS